jgi:branched-chain amino acid aminotransferase
MSFRDEDAMMWVNGALVPAGEATIPALDHGITVGDGIFEAVKVVHGQTFALHRHLQRMARSAAGVGITFPGIDVVGEAARAVVEANADILTGEMDVLRITLTAGRGTIGSPRLEGATPTLIAAVTHHEPPEPAVSVITVPWARNDCGALTGLKTTSYAENAMAVTRALEAGASEAIFPNTLGKLCEGTGSNVFVVFGGRLITPPLSDGPLAGITRGLVLEWTDAVEESLGLDTLFIADEVFLTSTGRDVQAVTAVDGIPVGTGSMGPVTKAARLAWASGEARSLEP